MTDTKPDTLLRQIARWLLRNLPLISLFVFTVFAAGWREALTVYGVCAFLVAFVIACCILAEKI